MKNKLFMALLLSAGLAPVTTFGQQQQQKREIVINRSLLPAMVTPTSKAAKASSVMNGSGKSANAPVRLEEIALPADSSVYRDKNGALHIQKELLMRAKQKAGQPVVKPPEK